MQAINLSPTSQTFLALHYAKSKTALFSLALARAISIDLVIPATPVDSIVDHYRLNCVTTVMSKLSDLNEIMILDYQSVNDLVLKFYQFRYYSLFPDRTVACFNRDTVVEDFFGIHKFFSSGDLATLPADPLILTDLISGFIRVIDDFRSNKV